MMLLAVALSIHLQSKDPLVAGFQNPPAWSRPHTWWHWMNGNVSKEGITADLEAMSKAGIGGAQLFTVDQGIPAGKAGYMSMEWRKLTAFAVEEANRLGIELCIHNCAGWSSSGGPWITPEDAMQVLAWSELKVAGGKRIEVTLPAAKAPQVYAKVDYYRDIAVYAIPSSSGPKSVTGDMLGRTGVVRWDGLNPNLNGKEKSDQIINVTEHVRDGVLSWEAPEGDWTILRMGHVPTGKDNHPAPPEGDGLEVDKLSRSALDHHWQGMMAKVISDVGPLAGKSLNNALIDSYEVGSQNWTPKFREDFTRLRGYDPMPYLPAIAGFTVEDSGHTERFLWDVRRTIADLYAKNYFGYFGELCHRAGLKFSTEPYGNGGFDNIQAGATADIPMGEFWLGGGAMESTKLASSIGHVYGRPVVGAESFTADDVRGRFLEEPYMMKTVGDLAWCNGINRYIFHRYAMQPWTKFRPGMTMGPWGTHLERTQTWWGEAATWLKYVARSQYLLQSGQFVADVLVYQGENAPLDLPYSTGPDRVVPTGYDYDGCDRNALLSLKVKNGRVITPSGMSYSLLVLPKSEFMTSEVAQKIMQMVFEGARIVGPKPKYSPTLNQWPASEQTMRSAADLAWGDDEPTGEHGKDEGEDKGEHRIGKGTIYKVATAGKVLKELGIAPDFEYSSRSGGSRLAYIHRRINASDAYFVSNQKYNDTVVDLTFRVSGKVPELWNPETGAIRAIPAYSIASGRTSLSLSLGAAESVFVVFRNAKASDHLTSFSSPRTKPSLSNRPRIAITKARYETADGRGVDVTAKVRELYAQGDTEIGATNTNFGDPVVNVVKHLVIDYSVNGKPVHAVYAENEVVTFGPTAPQTSNPSAYDLRRLSSSRFEFTPWIKDRYVATHSGGKTLDVDSAETPMSVDLSTNWKVAFAPNLGAPASANFAKLASYTANKEFGIKYFSGTATYQKSIVVSPAMAASGRSLRLDLGDVKNFATVSINGRTIATLWKPPFALDVTGYVHAGENKLEVKVTNLWVNRMIGDEQLPPEVEWNGMQLKKWPDWLVNDQPRPKTGRITFSTWHFWQKDSPLLESGLIGPVSLKSAKRIVLKF